MQCITVFTIKLYEELWGSAQSNNAKPSRWLLAVVQSDQATWGDKWPEEEGWSTLSIISLYTLGLRLDIRAADMVKSLVRTTNSNDQLEVSIMQCCWKANLESWWQLIHTTKKSVWVHFHRDSGRRFLSLRTMSMLIRGLHLNCSSTAFGKFGVTDSCEVSVST